MRLWHLRDVQIDIALTRWNFRLGDRQYITMTSNMAHRNVLTRTAQVAPQSAWQSIESPEAFVELWERHHAAIFKYIASRLGPDAAEDVASATFEAAFKSRAKFDPSQSDGSALPWLFGIATRQMSRHRDQQRRWFLQVAASNSVHSVPVDGVSTDTGEVRSSAIFLALTQLSKKELEPLLLVALAGLSYGQVAEALAMPVGTVRSRINRARLHLASNLAKGGSDASDR